MSTTTARPNEVATEIIGETGPLVRRMSAEQFRDALGSLNQAVSSVADRTYLVVAGRVLPLAAVTEL